MITVVVIGAGPAGLTLANLLQRAEVGVRIVVIEHRTREQVETRARGGLISASAVDVLAAGGLADGLLARGMRHDTVEFRLDGESTILKIGDLAGASQWVYPQQKLAGDLIEAFLAGGGIIHWGVRDVELRNVRTADPEVSFRLDGDQYETFVTADLVAGCDGWWGPTRRAIAADLKVFTTSQPFEWMCLLAQAPPSADHVLYGIGDGLGLMSPRTPPGTPLPAAVTRFYLSVAPGTLPDWSHERVWTTIADRLACDDPGWALLDGPLIGEPTVMEMTATVTEPMQVEPRVLLLGDAAHPPTPVAAKGVSLAVHDAKVAADSIAWWALSGDDHPLLSYSQRCLHDHVRPTFEFTDSFTNLIHPPDADARQNTRAWLETMRRGGEAAVRFAEGYVDPPTRTPPPRTSS